MLTAAGMMAAVSGCGPSDAAADENVVTYWSQYTEGEAQQKVMASAIADFEKKTGIEVDVSWQGRSNVSKIVPALTTDNVPDLIDSSTAKLAPVLAATNQALPLDDVLDMKVGGTKVSDVIPDKYIKGSNLYTDKDKLWMIPYSLTSDAIWFNAAKHPGLATNPPQTWDEFISVLDTLKAEGVTPLVADGDIGGYNAYWFVTLLMRNMGPGALQDIAHDKTGRAWDNPKVLDAAKKVEQLVDAGYFIDGYAASKFPAQQQNWADNQAAMIFMGSWLPTEAAPYAAKGFEFDSFPFPTTTGKFDSARADFIGHAIPEAADNPEGAKKFIAFLLKKKYQDAFGKKADILPIRPDSEVAPTLQGIKQNLKEADEFHQQNDGVTLPGYNEKIFWPTNDSLFKGTISAEQFVATMKAKQIEYWEGRN